MSDSIQRYNKIAIILHLVVGIFIVIMFGLGWYMAELPKDLPKVPSVDLFNLGIYTLQFSEPVTPRTFYFGLHKSLGVTIFALILIRLLWRLTHAAPAFPITMKAWQKKLAELTHQALYLLMLLVPLTGVVMAVLSKYGLLWFGVRLTQGLDNEHLRQAYKEAHEVVGIILVVLVVFHILSAIKHQVIDKDNLLKRMSLR